MSNSNIILELLTPMCFFYSPMVSYLDEIKKKSSVLKVILATFQSLNDYRGGPYLCSTYVG